MKANLHCLKLSCLLVNLTSVKMISFTLTLPFQRRPPLRLLPYDKEMDRKRNPFDKEGSAEKGRALCEEILERKSRKRPYDLFIEPFTKEAAKALGISEFATNDVNLSSNF